MSAASHVPDHMRQVRVDGLVVIRPLDAEHCGSCPMMFPGPEQDHCAAFAGAELRYIGQPPKYYARLQVCRDSEVPS